MKIFILSLFVTSSCFSAGWFPVEKEGAINVYVEKSMCESSEGFVCYDIELCPLDECEFITEITQDDLGINIETKVLKNSEAKKNARLLEVKQAQDAELSNKAAKKASKDKVKAFKFKGTTIKELRDELNDYAKENAEVVE